MANLQTYLQELERDFTVDTAKLKHITNHFIDELDKGKIGSSHMENAS
jgi:hexokinase